MGTMNISLPDTLRSFVEDQVSTGGYGTSSEYVRELIRRDQDRAHLKSLLIEGVRSPVVGQTDDAFFASLRSRVGSRRKSADRR